MYTPAGRRGSSLPVVILLLISVLLEQCIAALCPLLSDTGGIRPMIVFLDIPLRSPVVIDWLPAGFIFILFYAIVKTPYRKQISNAAFRGKLWGLLGRWWLLLILLLISGGCCNMLSDNLPRQVRNGIDSFGIRADLVLPYPSGETIHLQGSMVMLVFFIIGWRMLVRQAAWVPAVVTEPRPAAVTASRPDIATEPRPDPAYAPHPAPAPTTYVEVDGSGRGKITMRIPEPVAVKEPVSAPAAPPKTPAPSTLKTPPAPPPKTPPPSKSRPCIPAAMPGAARKMNYPCVVDGAIQPAALREKEVQP